VLAGQDAGNASLVDRCRIELSQIAALDRVRVDSVARDAVRGDLNLHRSGDAEVDFVVVPWTSINPARPALGSGRVTGRAGVRDARRTPSGSPIERTG
jgi:serine/threonine protein kinase HipA of HipAB toxin-antitoxin module